MAEATCAKYSKSPNSWVQWSFNKYCRDCKPGGIGIECHNWSHFDDDNGDNHDDDHGDDDGNDHIQGNPPRLLQDHFVWFQG